MCTNTQRYLCDNDCDICFERSFASSEKSIFWSSKNDLKPRQVFKSSNKKFILKCDKSNHEFKAALNNIKAGKWCPYPCCVLDNKKKLCEDDKCDICFQASFASENKAKFWLYKKNQLKPHEVCKCSGNTFWFRCEKSNHIFNSSLKHITYYNSWCPYPCCASPSKILCSEDDCRVCFNASFESHQKSKYWMLELNGLTPREVFKSSILKCWFKCNNNHIFDSTLSNIINGNWCPKCSNNGYSKKAINWLNNIMFKENINIQHAENEGEYVIKTPDFKSSVDGYCKETNTVYEFHGDFWHGNPNKFNRDDINPITKTTYGKLYDKTIKRENIIKNFGYNLVTIWECDFME
jgi:hypothetical protein